MKILLTGANGYIGKRLLPILLEEGHEVFCLVRDPRRFSIEDLHIPQSFKGKARVIKGNLLDEDSLGEIPLDLDAAYYLVHSMSTDAQDFYELEEKSASNFVEALKKTQAKQIIYLSGIVNDESLSQHLSSRLNVEGTLMDSGINATVLRAAIIIGSGSASFEIIRDLVEKLPVMIAPKWLKTKCQPIAIRDVLGYLKGVLLKEKAYNRVFDVAGPDILNYKEMLEIFAEVRGLKRFIISVPLLTPKLSSYWLYFVTTTTYPLARSLVESMKNEVILKNKGIEEIVKINCKGYKESVELAFTKIEQNEVVSSWTDALIKGKSDHDFLDNIEVPRQGCLFDEKIFRFDRDCEEVRKNIWKLGGDNGWYGMDWAWQMRGFIDKLVSGVGIRRHRRDPENLKAGDALDFWRVILADEEGKRLILHAEMKIPGEAWLEFRIFDVDGVSYLKQIATFRPQGLFGRLYWYAMHPFHIFIFNGMAKGIINK